MIIQENIPLASYTTFKIGGNARFFCKVTNEDELIEAVKFAHEKGVADTSLSGAPLPILVLGGGSNLLISDDGFPGLVIKNEIRGVTTELNIESVTSDSGFKFVSAGSGEVWDDIVAYIVDRGLWGIENLSAIPGTVGATPVQNIGAYGAEVSQAISSVRVLDTKDFDSKSPKFVEFSNAECKFGYRDSIFKHEHGRYIISRVTYKLSKKGEVTMNYKDVRDYFNNKRILKPTISEMRKAVVEIRASKLPDWTKWGTAGSFFKNPYISVAKFVELKVKYPTLPGFPELDGRVKVSLGWIFDKVCNARGLVIGNAGTYEKQALVLVAKPGAKAVDVKAVADELISRVKEKTGIVIEPEVEWVG